MHEKQEKKIDCSSLFYLFITFMVLKLTSVIGWSWWWVTAPLWGPFALVTAFFLAVAIVAYVLRISDNITNEEARFVGAVLLAAALGMAAYCV